MKPIDPRILITPADAEAILGEPVEEVTYSSIEGRMPTVLCTYVTTSGFPVKGISLFVYQANTAAEALAALRQTLVEVGGALQLLGGLGQAAYWEGEQAQLYVLEGNVWLLLSADSRETLNSAEAAWPLALSAVQRLRLLGED